MNAREVIADELRRLGSFLPDEETDNLLFRLSIRGFTIMSKEDVEAVRDKALEEAAKIGNRIFLPSDKWGDQKEAEIFNAAVHQYALEIRSLKSGGRE